ncbi:ATP-binding protein [Nocardioides yefusunii]|uniref:ATP-binding protein n=1 Tax=Nocardioides yefusunii TaxID=2500546 RepID=A0ABW1QXW5_9ACTN|nr:ATP-binding protein [Nocardioides yefusunii]
MSARVIVLSGPSGSGKSRLSERLGIPVLRLDDFYRGVGAPDLPMITTGANAGMVDWDDPRSWDHEYALRSLIELCTEGVTEVPNYSIPVSSRIGTRTLTTGGATHFVAEGIFAPEIVADCERLGILEAAYCITQHPLVTFWRRLQRDLRERRKAPMVLLRRGWALKKAQRGFVAAAVAKGCVAATPEQAWQELSPRLANASKPTA